MKVSTKQKIINKAVKLYNQKGYASVTLFELAGALDMTRGNLTYHFKTKDLLLEAIADELWLKMKDGRKRGRMLPSFENLHDEIQVYFKIQKAYAFVFLDHHVLNHPVMKEKFRSLTNEYIKECEATIAFAISIGNMKPEPNPGMYHRLAHTTWMVSFYWLNQKMIRGEKTSGTGEDAAMSVWSMLLPHLTEKGLKAFQKFFGDDLHKKLGNPFKADLSNYVGF